MSTQTRREICVEDREWRESLDYVIEHAGSERAEMLLRILRDRARRRGARAGGYIGLELGTVYSSLGSQVTVGREPFTEVLNLESTEVAVEGAGFIVTDKKMRTEDHEVYAVGDVTGAPLLAHKAAHQGRVAAEAIAGEKSIFEPNAIPAVEYTIPQVAWSASGRNITLGKKNGITKLIIDPSSERVVGGAVVAKGVNK